MRDRGDNGALGGAFSFLVAPRLLLLLLVLLPCACFRLYEFGFET
jgi:hypothetical protein